MSTYQAIWEHGMEVREGQRVCDRRYELLRPLLDHYKRPFTVLDLGADQGYFCKRIEYDYPATCIAIEHHGSIEDIIHLRISLTPVRLLELAACEHFDVVLCLNILHHFEDPIRMFDIACKLGDHLVVETPPPLDVGACGTANEPLWHLLRKTPHGFLGATESHVTPGIQRPIFLFDRPKTTIKNAYYSPPLNAPAFSGMEITSSYRGKYVRFTRKNEVRAWLPGINLRTFQQMNGQGAGRIATMIAGYSALRYHGDIEIWNFILNRDGVHLIDWDDKRTQHSDIGAFARVAKQLGGRA